MKDSGIKWIGNVPKEWKSVRIKDIIKILQKSDIQASEGLDEGKFPFYTSSRILNKWINTCLYKGNAITMATGGFASVNYSDVDFSTSTDCFNFTCGNYTKFVYYYLFSIKNIINDLWFEGMGLKHLQKYDLLNSLCFLPSEKEQKQIVNFLDKKIDIIDKIISDLNSQIDLLNKDRDSLIINATTKGINKNVELKQTNKVWIGSIPKYWNLRKIKHCFIDDRFGIKVGPFGSSLTDCVVGNEEGKYKIYGQANLIHRDFEFGDNYIKEKDYNRLKNYEVLPGDIVVSMMGTIGKCRVVPNNIKPGIMDSHLIKIRLNKSIMNPKYFEYQYEAINTYEQLLYESNGSIMNGLNSTIVKNIYFVYPPIDEQNEIVNYLDKKCSEIEEILNSKIKQKEQMEQYKKSVIYEYVTGKKRVEGAEELYG